MGAAVFVDDTAPAHQRYKCMFMGMTDQVPGLEELPHPGTPVDPMTSHHGQTGIFAATSPDGLDWTVHHQPIAWHFADTGNVAEWDPALQTYVWYTRGWSWGRRTIARAETTDFHDWPLATPLVTASPIDTPWSDIYTIGKTTYPGDPSTHLMFPNVYDRSADTTSVVALASADNIGWHVIPGGPCLQPGPRGSVDGGCVFAGTGLVQLPGDRIGIPYGAFPAPHKHAPPGHGEGVAWATWPRGRLAGLVADGSRRILHPTPPPPRRHPPPQRQDRGGRLNQRRTPGRGLESPRRLRPATVQAPSTATTSTPPSPGAPPPKSAPPQTARSC